MSKDSEFIFEEITKILLNPRFDKKYFQLEKDLILRSLKNGEKDPVKQCFSQFNKIIFQNHPYSLDLYGTQENIKKFTLKEISDFHQMITNQTPLLLTYVGDENIDDVLPRVTKLLSNLKSQKSRKSISNKMKLSLIENKNAYLSFDRAQTHLMLGRKSFKISNKEHLYLKMLTTYLSGQSSPLFVEIRDKLSLCYNVQPVYFSGVDSGYWGIYIATSFDKASKAKTEILKLVNQLKEKGINSKELNRLKIIMDGQNKISLSTIEDYANYYSIPVLHGLGLNFQDESFQSIKKISANEFNKFLRDFLNFKWNIVEVGKR